jgi:hypothetical protein
VGAASSRDKRWQHGATAIFAAGSRSHEQSRYIGIVSNKHFNIGFIKSNEIAERSDIIIRCSTFQSFKTTLYGENATYERRQTSSRIWDSCPGVAYAYFFNTF